MNSAFSAAHDAAKVELNRQLQALNHDVVNVHVWTSYQYRLEEAAVTQRYGWHFRGDVRVRVLHHDAVGGAWHHDSTKDSDHCAADYEFDVGHTSSVSVVHKVCVYEGYTRRRIGTMIYEYIHRLQAAWGNQLCVIGGLLGATPDGAAFLGAKFGYRKTRSEHEAMLEQRPDYWEHDFSHFCP